MKKKNLLKNEKGFTLIEIIAVIIIMGILAAVAVPRFFSMQEDAKIAALNGGLSEAAARFNHAFAKYILIKKKAPTDVANDLTSVVDDGGTTHVLLGPNAATAPGTDIGDFEVTWEKQVDGKLKITVNTADTIGATALADMDTAYKEKIIDGITWDE